MGKIETFEDIEAWQEAKALAISIYSASNVGEFSKDYSFKDQLRRSAVSISSNIAEGFERQGDKEFSSRTLKISKMISGLIKYLNKERP